ncbi:LPP20 family lipoprotein [Vibrio hannami]|uniref:LPP20 family lipoprotein n=1 Tax=Vibrio hannami TaxID=2717094 RepID=UPI00240F56EC|nr:LPP20 family lipoprotein [Vibrio hannami]MDG3088488.1 LPP20 family lipoprotein [Vibrio hannami]
MKVSKSIIALVCAGALGACSSTSNEPQGQVSTNQPVEKSWCTFDDGKTEAPEFFCTGAIDNFAVTGRGSSPKSDAGMNYMMQQAALAARVELAQNVRTQVSNMVKNYLGTTGVAKSETIDAAASSTSESITDESLMGSRIVRRIIGPEGEVYVWVAIDENNLVATAQNAIRTSMANDEAAWQKFQAEKSHEEMAKKIADLRNLNNN